MLHRILTVCASSLGLAIGLSVIYVACVSSDSGGQRCARPAQFSSQSQLEAHRVMELDEFLDTTKTELSALQQNLLAAQGHLIGELEIHRPIKHPNGEVEQPVGWLEVLPEGHPCKKPPAVDDPTFAAWFEIRIIDPLLYDPSEEIHREWGMRYLQLVHPDDEGIVYILSLAGPDSSAGCD